MEELSTSLRRFSCSDHLDKGHERSKKRYDKDARGETFAVGDQVWLYVPAVKRGRTKKLASFWRGPFTRSLIGFECSIRLSLPVGWFDEDVASASQSIKTLLWSSYKSTSKASKQKDSGSKAVHTSSVQEKNPVLTDDTPVVTTEQEGGFVDDEVIPSHTIQRQTQRIQRIRRPTDRYRIYIEH